MANRLDLGGCYGWAWGLLRLYGPLRSSIAQSRRAQ